MKFSIYTPGPGFDRDFEDLDAVIAYAKDHMPLKRGWGFRVSVWPDGRAARTSRVNSKGRDLGRQYAVTVVAKQGGSNAH